MEVVEQHCPTTISTLNDSFCLCWVIGMARPSVVERLHAKQSSSSSLKGKLRTLFAKLEGQRHETCFGHSDSDVVSDFDLPLNAFDIL